MVDSATRLLPSNLPQGPPPASRSRPSIRALGQAGIDHVGPSSKSVCSRYSRGAFFWAICPSNTVRAALLREKRQADQPAAGLGGFLNGIGDPDDCRRLTGTSARLPRQATRRCANAAKCLCVRGGSAPGLGHVSFASDQTPAPRRTAVAFRDSGSLGNGGLAVRAARLTA